MATRVHDIPRAVQLTQIKGGHLKTKLLLCAVALSTIASADLLPIGYISYDITSPGSTAAFDIVNFSGPNSSDPTWPVATSEHLSGLSLTVSYTSGPDSLFGPAYFSLAPGGLSFFGGVIPIGGANPQPTSAILTGTFLDTFVTLTDATTRTIDSTFTATITPSSGPTLADGDLAVIYATTSSGTVPEPGSWILLGTIVLALGFSRRLTAGAWGRKLWGLMRAGAAPLALLAVCAILVPAGQAQVKLTLWTSPPAGVAGNDFVNLQGGPFPVGHGTIPAANATVSFSLICGGAVAATAVPTSILVAGLVPTYRAHVKLPASLATNTYFASIAGTTSDGTAYSSTNCSQVTVTHTSSTLSACVPTSSLGIVAPVTGPAQVKALVPNGCWGCGTPGLQVVQLEPGSGPILPPVSIPTGAVVNSCAGNPATGEGICVANSNAVYKLSAANVVSPWLSGSNAFTGFSGGSCENCGVAVNALTNQAVIAMGHAGSPSGTALQTVDMFSGVFTAPVDLHNHISEDISIDPTRGYILSPNESNNYNIEQFNSTTGAMTGEFGRPVAATGGEFDSAAEDCSTGIALSAVEFTSNIYIADLTQASFIGGAPGSWSGAAQLVTLAGTSFSAGTSGITVAPGSSHLAAVTGEFGGSSFAILQLPSTSGSGIPALVDYAYVSCIVGVSAGLDPHTVSAYTSPNGVGKAYTVFASGGPPPDKLAVVDMAAVLAMPRVAGTHTVIGTSGSCLADGDGFVRFVPTH
jgi:hypothetical protein